MLLEFKVYFFLLKVFLYLLIIFWKIRIDKLCEENGSMKIPPPGDFPPKKFPLINPHLEDFQPENWRLENSHQDYYHPFH